MSDYYDLLQDLDNTLGDLLSDHPQHSRPLPEGLLDRRIVRILQAHFTESELEELSLPIDEPPRR